jgi:hypothetical protein
MGLIIQLGAIPAPRRLDEANHRLPAGMNVDMLDRHLLLAPVAVVIERFKRRGERTGELASLREILAPRLSMLLGNNPSQRCGR